MNWDLYLNFFLAMLAIINPLTIIPLWAELTSDVSNKVRFRLALMVTIIGIFALIIFLIGGVYILKFFSIDLMVFKVAGGILLMITGIKMLEGTNTKLENADEYEGTPSQIAKVRFRKIMIPFVIPVLVGPGSITTVILFGVKMNNLTDYLLLPVVLIISLLIIFAALNSSSWIEKKVDPLVFTTITRLFSIIVTAIAIQFMLEGLGEVFPNWVNYSSPIQDAKTNIDSVN